MSLHHFGNAQVAQGFAGPVDGGGRRLFPGILAGADQFNDLVDALCHCRPPVAVRQDAGAPAVRLSLASGYQRRKDAAHHCFRVTQARALSRKWPGGSNALRPFRNILLNALNALVS